MTDLRKAAEMALEALEWNYGTDLENIENCTAWLDKMNASIQALRQALAQPEREWVGLDGEIPGLGLVTEEFYNGMLFAEDVLRDRNT